jgi:hypothetical protein
MINVDRGQVNLIRVQRSRRQQLFNFNDTTFASDCNVWIKVASCFMEDYVACMVALPPFNKSPVAFDCLLKEIFLPVDEPTLLRL